MHALLLAGGGGTRLWPVSRKSSPKQTQPFIDAETLLQKTYKRLRKGFGAEHITIACGKSDASEIRRQLPRVSGSRILVEPVRRNTGVAIAYAVMRLFHEDPKTIFVNVNSDAYVQNETEYLRVLRLAEKAVRAHASRLVLIGVNPTYPETGYGYIQMGDPFLKIDGHEIFDINRFVEKPDRKTAKRYLKSWKYLWNPTLVVGRADTFLALWKKHQPAHYRSLMAIEKSLGTAAEKKTIEREFRKMTSVAIDYAILEKARNMLVLPADFGWTDIGNWRAVADVLSQEKKNVTKGKVVTVRTDSSLIYNLTKRQIVTTACVRDMIIIVTEDAVLVCPKTEAHEVKSIVEELERKNLTQFL